MSCDVVVELPSAARHVPVAYDQIYVIGPERLQRFGSVARGQRVMTEAGERLREHAANGRILVDEEDSSHSRRFDDRAGVELRRPVRGGGSLAFRNAK